MDVSQRHAKCGGLVDSSVGLVDLKPLTVPINAAILYESVHS